MKTQTTAPAIRWLRANVMAPPIGVDREAKVIRGMVLAQEGPFKDPRGEFGKADISSIVRLASTKSGGLKSHLAHATLSDDGIGKFLGRVRDVRLDRARIERDGKTQQIMAARGDLHFDSSAFKTPHGDLATYVMDLASSDPDAISSSLVLEVDEEFRLDAKGNPLADRSGKMLPPLWHPTKLHASDIVDTGAAVDGLLSADDWGKALSVGLTPELRKLLRFDRLARLASQCLDGMFAKRGREEITNRVARWLRRYLDNRFGRLEEEQLDDFTLCVSQCEHEKNCALFDDECTEECIDECYEPYKSESDKSNNDKLGPCGCSDKAACSCHHKTPKLDKYRLRLDKMAIQLREIGVRK